jgi:hypothetical protein
MLAQMRAWRTLMRIAASAIGALALIFASACWAAGPIIPVTVGNWSGGAYTNDQTGAFSHCAAGTPDLPLSFSSTED